MTSSTVLAALGYSPSSAEATHHGQSGADAAPLPREAPTPSPPPRKIADLQADIEPTGISRHRSRSTQSPGLPMPCLELENNTAGRCSGPAGAGEVFI
jgi:hypothetical protein